MRILDPAMGSGHFLVEAVDFVARYLVSLGLGPMPDLGDESELVYWRRRVVQSCVYGVDVNPLAVELAKLSLWSMTSASGKPLSFLDHHLRCGDSLVGVRMADLRLDDASRSQDQKGHRCGTPAADQLSMLDDEAFARSMRTARGLGEGERGRHGDTEILPLSPSPCLPLTPSERRQPAIAEADLFGEQIPAELKPFLSRHYELATGQYDAYWLFYERSFWLLGEGGRHGFIVPDAVLARDEVEALRARLLQEHRITVIAPVGQAFEDPGIGAALLVWEKSPPGDHSLDVWQHWDDEWRRVRSLSIAALASTSGRRLLVDLDPVSLALVTHMQNAGRPLREFVVISRGEEAGRRRLRPVEKSRTGDVPILIGSDIAPLAPLTPSHGITGRDIQKDRSNYRAGKIVMVKTGRDIVCSIDAVGHVTLQSVYNLNPHPTCRLDVGYLAAILSSSLLSWYLRSTVTGYKQLFPQINQSNVEALPIRPVKFTTPADIRKALLEEGKGLYSAGIEKGDLDRVTDFVRDRLHSEPEQVDVVHDLLAWLAAQITELNRRRHNLRADLDPFGFLDRDIPFVKFSEAFGDGSISKGNRLTLFI